MPDPEVPERPVRRRFGAEYKLAILAQIDAAEPGGIGAILRREGLYSSHLVDWRRARDRGALEALARPSGRPRPNPLAKENERLTRHNTRLEQRLATAERIIDPVKSLRAPGHTVGPGARGRRERVLIDTALRVAPEIGMAPACRSLGVSRATAYRHRDPRQKPGRPPRPKPVLALSDDERAAVLAQLHDPRFMDDSPAQVYATLLDEGTWLASERTMYRILAAEGESRERRAQLRHPAYARPELLATAPNQLWSWDITKLKGPVKWTYYHLYVLLDVFSRYVPGWLLAHHESGTLADRLIAETVEKEGVTDGLMIHADRGPAMTSKTVALLFSDLGITESHSRPHVSNDDPFSEAQFKTLKYRPGFPSRFGSIEDARSFCRSFFGWYNEEHRHGGIGLLTPEMVHRGRGEQVRAARQVVLTDAYTAHPERFVRKHPEPPPLPTAVWINPPQEEDTPQSQ
jgi:putative transposase